MPGEGLRNRSLGVLGSVGGKTPDRCPPCAEVVVGGVLFSKYGEFESALGAVMPCTEYRSPGGDKLTPELGPKSS